MEDKDTRTEDGIFYTLDEIAGMLKVSKSTVHSWVRKGSLKVHRFGFDGNRRRCGRGVVTRVSKKDFDDFVAESGKAGERK